MATSETTSGPNVYATQLTALNNSGVSANAVVVVDAAHGRVTVEVDASGLEPGQVHPQHIHGFTDGTAAQSPTLMADADHDGFVELAEGQTTYGPIQLDLALNPDQAASDSGTPQFPTADANGNLHYVETFVFDPNDPNAQTVLNSITPIDLKEIVIHGESVGAGSGASTTGEVDGSAGYKPTLPVASGEFQQVKGLEARLLTNAVAHDQVTGGDTLAFLTQGPGSAIIAATGARDVAGNLGIGGFLRALHTDNMSQGLVAADWAGGRFGALLKGLHEATPGAFGQWAEHHPACAASMAGLTDHGGSAQMGMPATIQMSS